MRSPRLYQVFLVASLVVAAACDNNTKAPVAPDVGPAAFNIINVAAKCSNSQKSLISSEIRSLYSSNADKNEASKRLQAITGNCVLTDPTKLHQAGADDIAYVAFFLAKVAVPGSVGLTSTEWAQHINDVMLYAFGKVYGPGSGGVAASSFGQYGAIGVCGSAGCTLTDGQSLFTLRVNLNTIGSPGTEFNQYLFTIAPVANSQCQHESLDFHGPCHDVAVNPFTTFPAPYVTLGACTHDNEAAFTSGEFNLALPTRAADNPAFVTLPPTASTHLATFCNPSVPADLGAFAAASSGTHSILASIGDGMRKAGAKAIEFLSPKSAYAIHVFGSDVSAFCDPDAGCAPVGNVDPLVFLGNFTTTPPFGPFPATAPAEKGTWTSSVTPPGSITVQQALGNLTQRVVVLSQGGGACTNCGGLNLTGTVTTATPGLYPSNGTYEVTWSSLEDSPTLKLAPFVLRGSDGKKIAVLSYSQVQNSQLLTFTSAAGAVTVGSWVRDVAQTFTITVDLTAKTVKLTGSGLTTTSGGFIEAATDLKQWAAEFTGIDAGVIAVDNVSITRLQSTTP